jgi:hypothetical protein
VNPQIIDAWVVVALHTTEAVFVLVATALLVAYGPRLLRNADWTMDRYRSTSDTLGSLLLYLKGEETRKRLSSFVWKVEALAKTFTKPEHLR